MSEPTQPRQPIPDLKNFLRHLPDVAAREDFARRCGTTLPYLRLVAGGFKPGSAELAINVDRESAGLVRCEVVAPHIDFTHIRGRAEPDQGRAAA
jgi:DNA-binding transcriptional regulator YdaS (Cro superfamily)